MNGQLPGGTPDVVVVAVCAEQPGLVYAAALGLR